MVDICWNFCRVRDSEAAVSFHHPEFAHVFSFWKYVKTKPQGLPSPWWYPVATLRMFQDKFIPFKSQVVCCRYCESWRMAYILWRYAGGPWTVLLQVWWSPLRGRRKEARQLKRLPDEKAWLDIGIYRYISYIICTTLFVHIFDIDMHLIYTHCVYIQYSCIHNIHI